MTDEILERLIKAPAHIISDYDGYIIGNHQDLAYRVKYLQSKHQRALEEMSRLVDALEKLGHREEPEEWNNKDQIFGYLRCCEDIIEDTKKTLTAHSEWRKREGL